MRRWMLVGAALVGLGLALLVLVHPWGHEADASASQEPADSPDTAAQAPTDPVPNPVGHAPGTPPPSAAEHPAPEADGALEVEVLAGSKPVPGATARLYWHGERDPNSGELAWQLAGHGVTDERGRVRLPSPPGSYLLSVRARGQAPVLREVVRPHGVRLTSVRLLLEPGQSLTGRTVVQGTGEPLPMVEISLTAYGRVLDPWQRAEAPAEERLYATSNERGDFRLEGLAPGTYQVQARAEGYSTKEVQRLKVPTTRPLVLELALAGVIEGFVVDAHERPVAGAQVLVGGVAAASTTTGEGGGFSLEVEPGAHSVSARHGDEAGALGQPLIVSAGKTVREVRVRLGPGAVFEGHVVEQSSAQPVPGAHVDISPHGLNGDSGRAVADEAGHFAVRALGSGSYDVVASAPGHTQAVRAALTVAEGEHFSLELALPGTGSVEGDVKTPDGQPIAGAHVVGGSVMGDVQGLPPSEALTDAAGHYQLSGLSAGRLHLTARREGSSLGVSQMVDVSASSTERMDFTLEATGTLEGVVHAAHGSLPAEPLELIAYAQGRPRFGMSDLGRSEIGATGEFKLMLPPGRYGLLLSLRGGSDMKVNRPTPVTVEEGQTAHVELTWEERSEDGSLQGVVVEPDGTPSPRALVTLFDIEGSVNSQLALTQADEGGHFTLRPSQAPEGPPHRLKITARNGGRSGDMLDVARDARGVTVRLRPGASLQGRVVREGAPVHGFTLSLQLQGPGLLESEGPWEFAGEHFELHDVPAEPIQLTVRTRDGASGELLLAPSAGGTSSADITLRASALVRGRVLDASTSTPLPGVMVFLEGEPDPEHPGGETDAEGRFSLGSPRGGEQLLNFIDGRTRQHSTRRVTVSPGETTDLGDVFLRSEPASER